MEKKINMITNIDDFKFHELLQAKYIAGLEKLIKENETKFKVGRKGTYELLEAPTRDNSSAVYVDKAGKRWAVERVK